MKICEATARADPKCDSAAAPSAPLGCPIEISVAALYQRRNWPLPIGAEGVKTRVATAGTDLKYGAAIATIRPAVGRRPVEIAVAALYQPTWRCPVTPTEPVKICQTAAGTDLEDCAAVAGANGLSRPSHGHPVEIAIMALHQPKYRIATVD